MIRIALIGCDHAAADYGEAACRLQGARLAAVVDPDDTVARRTAEALDVPIRTASFEDLLRDNADAFDAVVIRRPCGSPRSVVEQAAAAGKHVLLDMTLLLQMETDEVSFEAFRSAGLTLMVGQAIRFLPAVAEVQRCLRSGILGAPGLLRIHDWRPPHVDEQADATPAIDQAVLPDVDLANWMFGGLPSEVYAAGRKKGTGPICAKHPVGRSEKLDLSPFFYLQIHLGYPDGGMALVDHSMLMPAGADYFSLSLVGSAGAAYADDHRNVHLAYRGGRPQALLVDRTALHHLAELQAFVDAMRTGRPPAIAANDGYKAVEVVRAAGRSLESGRALRLVGSRYEPV